MRSTSSYLDCANVCLMNPPAKKKATPKGVALKLPPISNYHPQPLLLALPQPEHADAWLNSMLDSILKP